jgi:DNA end-binding protein Ku
MALRPYWNGQIRLSLVSLPVNLYSALNRARQLPLHEIYRPTGQRVRHQNVVEDQPINREDIVKGYEVSKGEYVLLEPREIEALRIPSKKVLDIVQFVDAEEIEPVYFDTPYFVAPDGDTAAEAFVVIREALRETGKIGIGQLAIAGRERLCAIRPYGKGILLETLRYRDEIRDAAPYFAEIGVIKVDKEQLSLAEELIRRKTAPFDPEKFHDHYREALRELIDAKLEDRPPQPVAEELPTGKVVNLMDALRKSLREQEPQNDNAPRKPEKPKPARKAAAKSTRSRRTASSPRKRAS